MRMSWTMARWLRNNDNVLTVSKYLEENKALNIEAKYLLGCDGNKSKIDLTGVPIQVDKSMDVISELISVTPEDNNVERLRILVGSHVDFYRLLDLLNYVNMYSGVGDSVELRNTKNFLESVSKYYSSSKNSKKEFNEVYANYFDERLVSQAEKLNSDRNFSVGECSETLAMDSLAKVSEYNMYRKKEIEKIKKIWYGFVEVFSYKDKNKFMKNDYNNINYSGDYYCIDNIDSFGVTPCRIINNVVYSIFFKDFLMLDIEWEESNFKPVSLSEIPKVEFPCYYNSMGDLALIFCNHECIEKGYFKVLFKMYNKVLEGIHTEEDCMEMLYTLIPKRKKVGPTDLKEIFDLKDLLLECLYNFIQYRIVNKGLSLNFNYDDFTSYCKFICDGNLQYESKEDRQKDCEQRFGRGPLNILKNEEIFTIDYYLEPLLRLSIDIISGNNISKNHMSYFKNINFEYLFSN